MLLVDQIGEQIFFFVQNDHQLTNTINTTHVTDHDDEIKMSNVSFVCFFRMK